jgi:hypothetical protein
MNMWRLWEEWSQKLDTVWKYKVNVTVEIQFWVKENTKVLNDAGTGNGSLMMTTTMMLMIKVVVVISTVAAAVIGVTALYL